MSDAAFESWFAEVEARYLAEITFPEARRALQALSALYVEKRDKLGDGAALDGRGKRAAFGFFYGPLHYLVVREIVSALSAAASSAPMVVDLGCGTGVGGAAWATSFSPSVAVRGVDASAWAAGEATWTYGRFGLRGSAQRGDASRAELPDGAAVIAAFAVNELDEGSRARLLARLTDLHERGGRVLVVEPIAKRALTWWPAWAEAFAARGGRDDEWKFPAVLPERLRVMDRAAGMRHQFLTARSLYLAAR